MTLKAYVWGMRLVALFSIIALVFVIMNIDPETAGAIGIVLFYLVLFFVLSSVLNLILLRIRKKIINDDNAFKNVKLSFRQGILLAILAIGLLVFQSFNMLVWWDGLLLLGAIFLIEFYFLSKE